MVAEHSNELQQMLTDLNIRSKQIGLTMNLKKTQVMYNELANSRIDVKVENTILEKVQKYTYLGQIITMSPNMELEIKNRISQGWRAFGAASDIFKSNMPLCLKRKVYNQSIIPTMTYGAETWNLTKKQTLKFRTAQRAHERILLGITWRDKKTATWIRKQTGLKDIQEVIKTKKWNWAGHLQRITDDRWTKLITEWVPLERRRSRGRQRVRWRDELDQHNRRWRQKALEREAWKKGREAFVLQWTYNG